MTRQEVIEYVESLGYTKTSHRLLFNNNSHMIYGSVWYTIDGMENYALKIEEKSITIWTKPYINQRSILDEEDTDDELTCAYNSAKAFNLNVDNDSSIKDTLKKLMDDTFETLHEFKKLLKERRLKAIEGL